jgi:hypothetical protein
MVGRIWVGEILTELTGTYRGELKKFLVRRLRDAMRDPTKPFRVVFSPSAKPFDP